MPLPHRCCQSGFHERTWAKWEDRWTNVATKFIWAVNNRLVFQQVTHRRRDGRLLFGPTHGHGIRGSVQLSLWVSQGLLGTEFENIFHHGLAMSRHTFDCRATYRPVSLPAHLPVVALATCSCERLVSVRERESARARERESVGQGVGLFRPRLHNC